jgi:cytochrome c oxidase subunit 4
MAEHVTSRKVYFLVFGALMVFTALTVIVAEFDFGVFNDIVALAIAVTKALLVILFFMHVRWSTRLTWVVVASGFFWLIILFGMTMVDFMSRGWVEGTLK